MLLTILLGGYGRGLWRVGAGLRGGGGGPPIPGAPGAGGGGGGTGGGSALVVPFAGGGAELVRTASGAFTIRLTAAGEAIVAKGVAASYKGPGKFATPAGEAAQFAANQLESTIEEARRRLNAALRAGSSGGAFYLPGNQYPINLTPPGPGPKKAPPPFVGPPKIPPPSRRETGGPTNPEPDDTPGGTVHAKDDLL